MGHLVADSLRETGRQFSSKGYAEVTLTFEAYAALEQAAVGLLALFDARGELLDAFETGAQEDEGRGHVGFFGLGSERAVGAEQPDPKRMFQLSMAAGARNEQFLELFVDGRRSLDVVARVSLACSAHALRAVADSAACHSMITEDYLATGNNTLRLIEYPPVEAREVWLAAPHTGINLVSVCLYSDAPGLMVPDVDGWVEVSLDRPRVCIMLGELATAFQLTDIPATLHGVRAMSQPYRRRSMVWFTHPRVDATLPDGRGYREVLETRLSAIDNRSGL